MTDKELIELIESNQKTHEATLKVIESFRNELNYIQENMEQIQKELEELKSLI